MSLIHPPRHLSPSAISTVQQCPLRFKYSKLDKLPEPSTESQLIGSFVHEILANIYQLSPNERTIQKAREIAAELWGRKWETEVKGVGKPNFRWQVWWCIENAYKLEDPTEVVPGGTEQWVRGKVGNVPMVGIVDRWVKTPDNKLIVTDYKTGKMPTVAAYEEDKELQLVIYGYMLEKEIGLAIDHMELLYLKEGYRKLYSLSESLKHKMLTTVERTWVDVLAMCEQGDFPARPSVLCDWCAYKTTVCPAWSSDKSDNR